MKSNTDRNITEKDDKERDIYDKILVGALLMLAAEVLSPVPLLGPILQIVGLVL